MKYTYLVTIFFSLFSFADYRDYIYSDRTVTYNSLGQGGLIQLPTAEQKSEANINFTFTNNDIWKLGTLTVTPFNWLEASYFYYRPEDIFWGNKLGLYLDKGFNVKFSYQPKKEYLPRLAIGLDDFAGTGLFTREYAVATFNLEYLKLTSGIGWGRYANENTISNPLTVISDSFSNRPDISSQYSLGGKPSYDMWFRGDAALFAGIEYFIPYAKGIKLKLEYDPFDYFNFGLFNPISLSDKLRKKDSDLNLGISIPHRFGNLDISYIKGNTINLSFAMGLNFNKVSKYKKLKPKLSKNYENFDKKNNFYNDLLQNLSNNNLFLQTATISKNEASLTIESPDLRNNIISAYKAASITNEVSNMHNYDLSKINVGHLLTGIQINEISFIADDLINKSNNRSELIRNTKIKSSSPYGYQENEFKPIVEFPVIFSNFAPVIRSHIGSPERFYYGGLSLSTALEVQFSRNFILSSVFGYSLFDNFDEKESIPDSLLPNVRTDIVKYLQTTKYIEKLSLDYFHSPLSNLYAKYSFGILELMYSGYGGELLYKPFDSNFMIGYENYNIKKRDYNLTHKTLNYSVVTDHINLVYEHPYTGIRLKYSYGNYLAHDKGYTVDLSRTSESGFRSGFFFSRTNVPEEIFGEGSFDKGFYFMFPLDLLYGDKSKKSQKFGLKTMTRDGGQKLNLDNNLIDYINNASRSEILRGFNEL